VKSAGVGPGIFGLPVFAPCGEVLAGFGAVAPVAEPALLGQAVISGLAREVLQSVAQEVDVAALPGGLQPVQLFLLVVAVVVAHGGLPVANRFHIHPIGAGIGMCSR